MELFRTAEYYIFRQGEHSLWCDRKTGVLEPKTGIHLSNVTNLYIYIYISFEAWDLTSANDPHCMGLVHGIIGKLNPFPGNFAYYKD